MVSLKIYQDERKEFEKITQEVKWIQENLTKHGFKTTADGILGINTDKQVRAFQKAKNLTVDGIVGVATRKALEQPYKSNFKDSEFLCGCKGRYCNGLPSLGVDPKLKDLLEVIRAEVNRIYPLKGSERGVIINAGYRCPEWNRRVGGAANSQHKQNPAKAADIRVNGVTPKQLGVICDRMNPNGGVGLGGKNIVHVDTRNGRSRWTY